MVRIVSRILLLGAAVVALAFSAGGCDWFDDPVEANLPPDTILEIYPSAGELEPGDDAHFQWRGFDPDGDVVGYEWSFDDTLFANATTAETLLIRDVAEGEYTFAVRSVDDDGDVDPEPASASFAVASGQGLVDRAVLAELVTFRGCANCPNSEAALETMLDEYGAGNLCVIAWHVVDPLTTTETQGRVDWYLADPKFSDYAGTAPLVIFDGARAVPGAITPEAAEEDYRFEIDARTLLGSPLSLRVAGAIGSTEGDVSVTVRVEDELPGDAIVLRIVVIEEEVNFLDEIFEFVARDVLEDAPLSVSSYGDSVVVDRSFDIDASWNPNHLDVIAFVQDDSTKEIIQSGRLAGRRSRATASPTRRRQDPAARQRHRRGRRTP